MPTNWEGSRAAQVQMAGDYSTEVGGRRGGEAELSFAEWHM